MIESINLLFTTLVQRKLFPRVFPRVWKPYLEISSPQFRLNHSEGTQFKRHEDA